MKFSHTLKFNSVPDWAEHYIGYSTLKKLIYQIERDIISASLIAQTDTEASGDATEQTLLLGAKSRANAIFIPALDKELDKVTAFYVNKERELFAEVAQLLSQLETIENFERSHPYDPSFDPSSRRQRKRTLSDAASSLLSSDDEDMDFATVQTPAEERNALIPTQWTETSDAGRSNSYFVENRIIEKNRIGLKRHAVELYAWLSELKSFANLNRTGFSKILKKYDKVTNSHELKSSYMTMVGEGYPFKRTAQQVLNDHIKQVEEIYAKICSNDIEIATKELKSHLREFIAWERNTIWRDIIGFERKSHSVGIVEEQLDHIKIKTPFGKVKYWKTVATLVICIGIFVLLLRANIFTEPEARNCFALLVFASLLWATEVIPLFVTSLLVPFLVVCLQVMRSGDEQPIRLDAKHSAKVIFAAMFSPVIMLLLGGFTIAAALSKYHIAKMMATLVLSKAGTNPSWVLLANMFVATIASMWISNVAAPVLCFSIIQPILRNLPPNNTFGQTLILGIALASNVGGMASPISSPQNLIALDKMKPKPSWIDWFIISIPLCILADLIVWLLLLWNYRPNKRSLKIHPIRASKDPWTSTQIFICFVTIVTIILWCVEKKFEKVFGDMGIIALIPIVLFFGTGILTKEDFNNFLWTVIILAMGGIALGQAVSSSGLLFTITNQIKNIVLGLTVWEVMATFSLLVLVVATFISHTVGALIIVPIVAQVGDSLGNDHGTYRNLLVMSTALMCSAAMGLPISGFPNMNAVMVEDEMGVRYLSTKDFLKTGVPASVLILLVVMTVGYVLMNFVFGY